VAFTAQEGVEAATGIPIPLGVDDVAEAGAKFARRRFVRNADEVAGTSGKRHWSDFSGDADAIMENAARSRTLGPSRTI
jgi:hypothetical protein